MFWTFSQIVVASNRNLMSSFGKASDPLCTEFSWANFRYFSFFSKSMVFNYFQHDKSEPDLKDDIMFTEFLNFTPNRFCFKPEPHEFVWKSVWSIMHRKSVSKFKIFFKLFKIWNQVSRFLIFQTKKCVFGPGDVLACPRIYRFVYQSAQFVVNIFKFFWSEIYGAQFSDLPDFRPS